MELRWWIFLLCPAGVGCGCSFDGLVGIVPAPAGTSTGSVTDRDTGSSEGETESVKLDLAGVAGACNERSDGIPGTCSPIDLPDSFEAVVEWSWTGPDGDTDTLVIPLVANLDDDNRDGSIDPCDRPDIVVTAGPPPPANLALGVPPAHLYALDGATGATHWVSERRIRATVTPALGDIDGDGDIEIVALRSANPGRDVAPHPSQLVVFDHRGRQVLLGEEIFESTAADAVALADLDADGDVEIMVADRVFDHLGATLFVADDVGVEARAPLMPFGVDLDDDGDLEVLWGRGAFHHDGTVLYNDTGVRQGFAQVADLDADGDPEIIVTSAEGLALVEPDGTVLEVDVRPIDVPAGAAGWRHPAAIHDIDSDRRPEVLLSVGGSLLALRLDTTDGTLALVWEAATSGLTGAAVSTAFDFLGDTTAEAVYGEQTRLFVFDQIGESVLVADRSSVALQDYPVVADVDDDGSAEIVVGSNVGPGGSTYPTVRVYGEANNRWVQARRIWNQHTYHVTNVGEGGEIPTPEPRHWLRTNTFRTNAQLEDGSVCLPVP